MTGGSLNLSSTQGTGDDILNINPQITYIKKVYKRHTNFGLETKEITDSSNSNVNFGERVIYNITKTGSLINDMHFEFTLPPTKNIVAVANDGVVDNSDTYCCWVDAVGYAIINEIKLEIDGNIIDRQTGLWYDIWNELTDPNRKEWSLVGKRNDNEGIVDIETKSRYYVPLKFYFNRNPGLSFPIFLLDENKIKVHITLNSLNSLIICEQVGNTNITINARPITSFKFFTTYVFLDKAEENRIKMNLPNEYLVETLDTHDNLRESDLSNIVLSNPVKELIWVIRNRRRLEVATTSDIPENNVVGAAVTITDEFTNDKFNYALHTLNNNLDYGSFDTFKTLNIQIGNKSRVDATEATFFRTIQPFKHHSNVPGGIGNQKRKYIYVYSFALNPEEYQPSGSYNFTKADEKVKLIFTGIGQSATNNNNNDLTGYRLDLFAFHYKLLSVYDGRIEFKDVPYSSEIKIDPVSEDPNMKGVGPEIVRQIAKKKCRERTEIAIAEEEKRLIAIEEEVRRRYSAKKPDVHRHQNFHKKKWAGLQGQQ